MRIAIVALAAAACASARLHPSRDVSGNWCTSNSASGWPLTLTLTQQGDSVHGTGTYRYFNRSISPPAGWVKVSGTTVGSRIRMMIQYEYGTTTQYNALITDGSRMAGLEAIGGAADSLKLSRGRCGLIL
jgi:hypothetical protein